jgi:hypothetical protein
MFSGTGRAALALAQRLDQIQLLSSRCDEHNSSIDIALHLEGSTFELSWYHLHRPAVGLRFAYAAMTWRYQGSEAHKVLISPWILAG